MKPVSGIGLRSPHLAEIGRERPAIGFLEIHAENYLAGSPARQAVERLRADYTFQFTPLACRWVPRMGSMKRIWRAWPTW